MGWSSNPYIFWTPHRILKLKKSKWPRISPGIKICKKIPPVVSGSSDISDLCAFSNPPPLEPSVGTIHKYKTSLPSPAVSVTLNVNGTFASNLIQLVRDNLPLTWLASISHWEKGQVGHPSAMEMLIKFVSWVCLLTPISFEPHIGFKSFKKVNDPEFHQESKFARKYLM